MKVRGGQFFSVGGMEENNLFKFLGHLGYGQRHRGAGGADQEVAFFIEDQFPGDGRTHIGFELGVANDQLQFFPHDAAFGIGFLDEHVNGLFLGLIKGGPDTRHVGDETDLDLVLSEGRAGSQHPGGKNDG